MTIYKCKMCGGTLNITEGSTVAECEYCGTRQTVPTLDNEKKVNLFTRANRLRAACEFDKAYGVYESIVAEFPEEAEAYWGLILCKYGIEYVDDPRTGKKIPTCHRSSFDGVFDDANFELVMEYSDSLSRAVYREEAKEIERLRTRILEVSSKEEPYDIFICYKETDENGDRTIDSVIAQDVYDVLTEKGYKVFFSRITLEDKLGQEYEPYIFAALNSAKVMLAFGTDYEYYNAVWVKNEWSRYLSLLEKGEKKVLIPCYKGIDAYDMPAEFKRLQAQDMGKVGAVQDLVRGIEKIIGKKSESSNDANAGTFTVRSVAQVALLLKRVFMFLEDGNWLEAGNYCEKVLDLDPENGEAYLGKLMAELKVRKREDLTSYTKCFDESENYRKAIKYGDESLVKELEKINNSIKNQIQAKVQGIAKAIHSTDEMKKISSEIEGVRREILELRIRYNKHDSLPKENEEFDKEEAQINAEMGLLREQKKKLGVFARKEKMAIDDELEKKSTRLAVIRQNRTQNEVEFRELPSKEQLQDLIDEKNNRLLQMEKESQFATPPFSDEEIKDALKDKMIYKAVRQYCDNDMGAFKLLPMEVEFTEVGGTVEFGTFPQGRNGEERKIEWIILDKDSNRAFLISKYGLDAKPYNEFSDKAFCKVCGSPAFKKVGNTYKCQICGLKYDLGATWETCSLRTWLNETFYENAFNTNEKNAIQDTLVTADKNPSSGTDPGNDTKDRLFLLSINEAQQYFKTDLDRACAGTEFCYAQKDCKPQNGNCSWWLRSPGCDLDHAATVDSVGDVSTDGNFANIDSDAIRPALWINLEP